MALQKSITLQNYGLELPESYNKIDSIRIENKNVSFVIQTYASKEARDTNAAPLRFESFNVDFDELNRIAGDDLIAKLYNYVKLTNPEYSTDTLDV
jgi:hypothetical protein